MVEVDEIISKKNGLNYYKVDLHVHSPTIVKNESKQYDHGTTIVDLITELKNKSFNLVCIGHHNSLKAIEEILQLTPEKKQGITILPSIEISTIENAHIAIIFPDNQDINQIRDFLTRYVGLSHPPSTYASDTAISYYEDTKSKADKTTEEILRECKKRGFLVLAPHFSSSDSQLFKRVKSPLIDKWLQDDIFCIADCEKLPEYYLTSKKDLGNSIARIECSDAHNMNDIGKCATWIKMENCDYHSLTQILYEPQARVKTTLPSLSKSFYLVGASIDGGMLDKMTIHFNPDYNAIIGGTGSGKSGLIDVFKYVFSEFGFERKFQIDSFQRLKHIHKVGTRFSVFLVASGIKYKISREVPASIPEKITENQIDKIIDKLPPVEILQLIGGSYEKSIITDLKKIICPIIYGQNELINYSYDVNALRNIFSKKIPDDILLAYLNNLKEIKSDLKIIDQLTELQAEIEKMQEDIKARGDLIEDKKKLLQELKESFPLLENYQKEVSNFNSVYQAIENHSRYLINSAVSIRKKFDLVEYISVENTDRYKEINKKITDLNENLTDIDEKIKKFGENKDLINKYYITELKPLYDDYSTKFKEHCKKKGQSEMIEIEQYVKEQIEKNSKESSKLDELIMEVKDLESKKQELDNRIQKLEKQHKELEENWNKIASHYTAKMQGRTKITIDNAPAQNEFEAILEKIGLDSSQRQKIIQNYTSTSFLGDYQKEESVLKENLKQKCNFKEQTIHKLLTGISNERVRYELKVCLGEIVVNFYLKKQDNFSPISELSTGERCATLLNFVFCEGEDLVIIDQPEDNIDYNYIQDTITILKKQKETRQFIIVSHNQNLPVLADADLILVMKNQEEKAIIIDSFGCLENPTVYNKILDLEGGKKAFEQREKKYKLISTINQP